ncbi:MAG: ABC transporter permease [Metamycoplasmataceae bacterium]
MKNNISSLVKNIYLKIKNNFLSEQSVGGRRRLYNSLWALLFGIISSILIILFTGNNPFEFFKFVFEDTIRQEAKFATTIVVFVIATIGTAMCFKSGIFNIGVSGQMMAGGMTTVLILKLIGINGGTIFFSIIAAIMSGILVSLTAGVLKAYLKVNEVVSTILLNWIVLFVITFIIKSQIPGLTTSVSISQNQTDIFSLPDFFRSSGWIAILLIFAIILIISTWFLFSKTSIGYKMKMLALNKDASKYAGSNEKAILISIMTVSGALSGLAGFLFYSELGVIQAGIEPIALGFDTIAIALLVYSNPFGIGISSILFSIIKLGVSPSIEPIFPPLTADFAQIMFGIIIYIAAIGVVFEKFKIYTYIRNYYIFYKDPNYKEALATYKNNKKAIYETQKNNNALIKDIKLNYSKNWKEIKKQSITKKESIDFEIFDNNKKKFSDISEEMQQYYFEKISEIKKEKDAELFENKYFEITRIKNISKSSKLENKSVLNTRKNEILENYELMKQEKKYLKEQDNGNI